MKSPIEFLQCVLNELGTWCGTSTTRDLKKITGRYEHEGMSFLTISLPNLGKDFEKSLDQGFVGHDQFLGFSKTGRLPRLLGGFFDLVFDRRTGVLLDVPSIDAIFAIRQISLMFKKIELPCSDARLAAAMKRYIECEQEVRASDSSLETNRLKEFERIGRLLWADVLQEVDEDIYYQRIIPKHGPGATADKLKGNLKWRQVEWPERLDQEFPSGDFLIPNQRHHNVLLRLAYLEPGKERPVRVVPVPKTLETPRIIAVEPVAMQYMQQAIHARLQKAIDADNVANGLIGYASQIPNQEMARKGSRKGTLATLDLSEASDRVSNQHVRILTQNHPNLFRGVDACRSRKADAPGHGVIRLAKFASMGSALCFPMEAMVFCTIVFLGIQKELNHPLTKKEIASFLGKVRVYGDDIVVPVEFVQSVVTELEAFGLKVNVNKSFWSGKFRESCGKDYYDGHDVSIVRLRDEIPSRLKHVSQIVSLVSTRNQLYLKGMWESARYCDRVLESLIPYPVVSQESELLGRYSFLIESSSYEGDYKMDRYLHRPLVKGMVVDARLPKSQLDDVWALQKCLTLAELGKPSKDASSLAYGESQNAWVDALFGLPPEKVSHLERAGRPLAVNIKQRWASPY